MAALMLFDDQVVTVRHRAGSRTYHLLPGGGVGYRETLEDALVREVREETGLDARVGRPLLINDTIDPNGTRHMVNVTFEAFVEGGSITNKPLDARVEAVDLVPPSDLGELDMRPPLAEMLQGFIENPNAPALYAGSIFTPERLDDDLT